MVCAAATVNPPSKSTDGVNVVVPATLIVSPEALPKLTTPLAVNDPAITVSPDACDTVKLPTPILNEVPSNIKLASPSNDPAIPASTI